jgi:hypothetical protein
MKFRLIYPQWPKLKWQTEFHLPPHGPVVFAAALPDDVEVDFIDENLEMIDFDDPVDFVGISMMLTLQVKRGWEIADIFRRKGAKVICGGIGTMLHVEETMNHADSVFLGEAEGKMAKVFADFKKGRLQRVYDYLEDRPPIETVGIARREILKKIFTTTKVSRWLIWCMPPGDAGFIVIPALWHIWAGKNSDRVLSGRPSQR